MTREKELIFIVTTMVFIVLAGITSIFGLNNIGITGNVVMESPTEGQIAIQELMRAPEFKKIGDGANICINIVANEDEVHGYKVRKNGDMFKVTQSERYCEGSTKEDIVITFERYGALLSAKELSGLKFFHLSAVGDDVKVWQSRFIRVGGLVKQTEEFNSRYCTFLNTYFKGDLKEWGIDCDVDTESPGAVAGFFGKYWWMLLIALFIGVVSFVGVSLFKDEKDEEVEDETLDQLHAYIVQSRDAGLGDYKIKETLLTSGWDSVTVKLAFDKVRKHHLSSLFDRFEKVVRMPFLSKDLVDDEDDEFDL